MHPALHFADIIAPAEPGTIPELIIPAGVLTMMAPIIYSIPLHRCET
ncbi:hypothetical protein SAMN03080615_00708 [Amphritea atlantica]|uniref:Uncharacterized protein n=1 Tax=Amphritea atlantica TaxID=355243 RepID=A0A1H9E613_9GAMM|nr:hypothetical protein [Amphritea atlantica]SEQ21065.1 hypothetical protein SAMN03080615_00708 [Amphritea atlantica]